MAARHSHRESLYEAVFRSELRVMKLQHTLWVTYIVGLEPTNLQILPKSCKTGQWVRRVIQTRRDEHNKGQAERILCLMQESSGSPTSCPATHWQDSLEVPQTSAFLTEPLKGPVRLSKHRSKEQQSRLILIAKGTQVQVMPVSWSAVN